MSNAKHTPGPWFEHREGFSTVYVEARIGGGVIQEVAACGPTEAGQAQQDANARLIAAAPAMLEALEFAREWINFSKGYVGGGVKILEEIDAVIAKAKGES